MGCILRGKVYKKLLLTALLGITFLLQIAFAQGVNVSLATVRKRLAVVNTQLDRLKNRLRQREAENVQKILKQVADISYQVDEVYKQMEELSIAGPKAVEDRLHPILEDIRNVRLLLSRRTSAEDKTWQQRTDIWQALARTEHDLKNILILHEQKATFLIQSH